MNSPEKIELHQTDCQYCGDAGFCTFCERGKIYAIEHQPTKKDEVGEVEKEIKIKWADDSDGLGGFTAHGEITNTPEDRK